MLSTILIGIFVSSIPIILSIVAKNKFTLSSPPCLSSSNTHLTSQSSPPNPNGSPSNTHHLTYHPLPCIQSLPTPKIQAPARPSSMAHRRQPKPYKAGEVPVLCRVGTGLRAHHICVVRIHIERDRVEL